MTLNTGDKVRVRSDWSKRGVVTGHLHGNHSIIFVRLLSEIFSRQYRLEELEKIS
jgi:hypothetical protein